VILLLLTLACAAPATAQRTYDPGVTDAQITIGNTAPYTGAFSAYSAEERAEAAYFTMMNDHGGVNGRKIRFVSVDDGSDVRQTVAATHRLVEQEHVLAIFGSFGTQANLATRDYLNAAKIPQVFIQANAAVFNDPEHYPWTMGFFATPLVEGSAYARYILTNKPNAKIALLYARGEAGKEYADGLRDGLGSKASTLIVKEATFEYSDPASEIDAQVEALRDSGADVLANFSTGSVATQVIRKAFDLGWHPLQFIPNGSLSIAAFLDPAGLRKADGIISNARSKGWLEPHAQDDPAVRDFVDWMKRYNPQASLRDAISVAGYERAQALIDVLRRCGDDVSRANVMRQAASMDLELGILRPGIKIRTSATDFQPIKQLYLIRFDGADWKSAGAVIE
jgi:branched-chain amino acid transport system substrate-binding protein